MLRPTLYSVLEQAAAIRKEEDRVNFLKQNASETMHFVCKFAYDPEIQFLLPAANPPYDPNNHPDQENNLPNQIKNMFYLIKGPGDHVSPVKRESIFIRLLETVSREDAVLLLHVKNKKLPWKTLTPEVVDKAFPRLLSRIDNNMENNFTYPIRSPEVIMPAIMLGDDLPESSLVGIEGEANPEDILNANVPSDVKVEALKAIVENLSKPVKAAPAKKPKKAKSAVKKPKKAAAKKPTKKTKAAKKPVKKKAAKKGATKK